MQTTQHCRAKIAPIFDYLVATFQCNVIQERDVSTDKALLLWKEHLSWKQQITYKCSPFGLKSFALAEVESSYIWNLILYSGNETDSAYRCDFSIQCNKDCIFSCQRPIEFGLLYLC